QGVLGSESLIITLDDLKKIIIDIKVPENYGGILKPGLKAEVSSSAFEKNFSGKIETISSRIDPSTRSILSRIIVDNPNFEIIPGQLMTVKIIYDEINQIGVPESAVTIQGKTAFVYTVNDETVEKKYIKIGKRNFGKVSILSGINEGDKVIVEGVSKVRNKAEVRIITPKK
ncbi:MAG: efflux RND transporter periplasmic adaptor subunit, partial [Flavobacterium sp.]|nr:efflux RND transporter periplasmic adaptor subunit [Flavobacterium sp.]